MKQLLRRSPLKGSGALVSELTNKESIFIVSTVTTLLSKVAVLASAYNTKKSAYNAAYYVP